MIADTLQICAFKVILPQIQQNVQGFCDVGATLIDLAGTLIWNVQFLCFYLYVCPGKDINEMSAGLLQFGKNNVPLIDHM